MKRYSEKDKKAHINAFWKKKDKDPDYSLRVYAAEHSLKYYTLRDWYRDATINPRWLETRQHQKDVDEITESTGTQDLVD